MDIKLTEMQTRYGLRLEPSEMEGYLWLRSREGVGLALSNDEYTIFRAAHIYLMGAMDWATKDHPVAEVELC